MKQILFVVLILLLPARGFAQAATAQYDLPAGSTLAQGAIWQPTLYVNNSPLVIPQAAVTCTQVAAVVTCQFALPVLSTPPLTASGPQTFELSLKDAILGEGPRGAPLARTKPGAPSAPRFP